MRLLGGMWRCTRFPGLPCSRTWWDSAIHPQQQELSAEGFILSHTAGALLQEKKIKTLPPPHKHSSSFWAPEGEAIHTLRLQQMESQSDETVVLLRLVDCRAQYCLQEKQGQYDFACKSLACLQGHVGVIYPHARTGPCFSRQPSLD